LDDKSGDDEARQDAYDPQDQEPQYFKRFNYFRFGWPCSYFRLSVVVEIINE